MTATLGTELQAKPTREHIQPTACDIRPSLAHHALKWREIYLPRYELIEKVKAARPCHTVVRVPRARRKIPTRPGLSFHRKFRAVLWSAKLLFLPFPLAGKVKGPLIGANL